MGMHMNGICLECGHHFDFRSGGGFVFDLVRCEQCGAEECVSIKVISKLIDDHDFKDKNGILGACKCGGKYTLGAPVRCPKCRSTHIESSEGLMLYD